MINLLPKSIKVWLEWDAKLEASSASFLATKAIVPASVTPMAALSMSSSTVWERECTRVPLKTEIMK
jgi:hypothetical protein